MVGVSDPEWRGRNADEMAASARKMEVFAAMVGMIDQNIQRAISYLETTNKLDNTLHSIYASQRGRRHATGSTTHDGRFDEYGCAD
ncbi:hypothetical protein OIDMADRAFT_19998 [Oidiodendron maius Zn]|uniref:Uncharacterized protein n=1 Tax=Oidiodendron maius (strain Zn) TaxID=913774 RepID=A0A0C3H7H5_OIDMZ|nr:hypothetical protein OIDMADRAFT_19998 [Oidiodendron maius Zn]